MKRIAVLTIIILAGITSACLAEEWYVTEEASSYDYVSPAGDLVLAKEGTNPEYIPNYLNYITNEANKYMEIVKAYSGPDKTATPDLAQGAVTAGRGKKR